MKLFTTLTLLALAAPAFAQDRPPPEVREQLQHQLEQQSDFDPFAPLAKPEDGASISPLRCMLRGKFEAAVKAHEGSEVVTMTTPQAMFWRGLYVGSPWSAPGYPIGDGAVYAVKMVEDEDHKTQLIGVAAFTLGEFIVCNGLPIASDMVAMLFKAGGALPKDAR